jgi:hypothetical protein
VLAAFILAVVVFTTHHQSIIEHHFHSKFSVLNEDLEFSLCVI